MSGLNEAVCAKTTGWHVALCGFTLVPKSVESCSKAQKMQQVF